LFPQASHDFKGFSSGRDRQLSRMPRRPSGMPLLLAFFRISRRIGGSRCRVDTSRSQRRGLGRQRCLQGSTSVESRAGDRSREYQSARGRTGRAASVRHALSFWCLGGAIRVEAESRQGRRYGNRLSPRMAALAGDYISRVGLSMVADQDRRGWSIGLEVARTAFGWLGNRCLGSLPCPIRFELMCRKLRGTGY
jgi:hypothetical protein